MSPNAAEDIVQLEIDGTEERGEKMRNSKGIIINLPKWNHTTKQDSNQR